MSYLCAYKPRPYIEPMPIAQVELVPAHADDLKIHSEENKKKILRTGLVYWLKSSITGKIESTPRMIKHDSDVNQLKEWLDMGMMFIAKHPIE